MRYAMIEDGVVTNIIISSPEYAAKIRAVNIDKLHRVAIGWKYDGKRFIDTNPVSQSVKEPEGWRRRTVWQRIKDSILA